MILDKRYSTHIPMLIKAVQLSQGPVVEFGSGMFSTPILHWLCMESGRPLETYENYGSYFNLVSQFADKNHKIVLVDDWDKIVLGQHYGVVFIDHLTIRRSIDALRVKDIADYVVLHDSQTDHYSYSKVYPGFKYIYHWKKERPWTTVLSNFKDLSNLK